MKILQDLKIALVFGAIGITALAVFLTFNKTYGEITNDTSTVTANTYRTYDFFASTTASGSNLSLTATSTLVGATSTNLVAFTDAQGRIDRGYIVVAGAKKINVFFARGGVIKANTGSTQFSVQTSPDGTNWFNFGKLVSATSTSIGTTNEQGAAVITAATTTLIYGLDLQADSPYAIRCVVNNITDGEAACAAAVTF